MSAAYILDEKFSRPVRPLAKRSRRTSKPFVLTSEGLRKYIEDHTKTLDATLEFLHRHGCIWDKDGNVSVQPL